MQQKSAADTIVFEKTRFRRKESPILFLGKKIARRGSSFTVLGLVVE